MKLGRENDIQIIGSGAVSPAGWGLPQLRSALAQGSPLPFEQSVRVPGSVTMRARRVPDAPPGALPRHPRLRRAGQWARFAAAAVEQAMSGQPPELRARTSVIFAVTHGAVTYSRQFFSEALADPRMASPILFPETVFNAAASHIAALLGSAGPCDTLVGSSGIFYDAIQLAVEWLEDGRVESCVVAAAEEVDWVVGEGLALLRRGAVVAEGAAAILLSRDPAHQPHQPHQPPDPASWDKPLATIIGESFSVSEGWAMALAQPY
jgi:3-oxoacyl-(acyl-carrier-protein) synthase